MSSITIIIPALNEEGNIVETLQEVVPLLEKHFQDYEVLLFDDGSTDQTGVLADQLAAKNPKIKVTHNKVCMGLGYNYKAGVEKACKDYVMMIPGDNEIKGESFEEMFRLLGPKDIVIPHTVNMEVRPLGRQLLSRAFTSLINLISGLNIQYYNGTVIHRRSIIQKAKIDTDSFAYQAEALVRLIRGGATYVETGMVLVERKAGRSKALRMKNVIRVLKSICKMIVEVRLKT